MSEQTHPLEWVAAEKLPPHWKNGRRWLAERLNRGELRGVRYGRTWMMRDRDIDYMLSRYSNDKMIERPEPMQVTTTTPVIDGLSERSRRRLRAS